MTEFVVSQVTCLPQWSIPIRSTLHVNLPCHCEDRLEDHEKGEDWHLIALLNGYFADLTGGTSHQLAAHLCEASFGAPSKSLYLDLELGRVVSYHCASLSKKEVFLKAIFSKRILSNNGTIHQSKILHRHG